jgi:hypothetical protein
MATRYIIIHNTHNGCYDFQYYEDPVAKLKLTSITINPPKIFLFTTREEAQDFFEEYMNDVDCIDNRCKNGEEVQHKDYCTCGIIEMDDDDNPILFYNKKNQIFLLEQGAQVFQPPQELKNDAKNMNLTNNIMRKCKKLSREQRKRYIELGKYCEDCNSKDDEGGNEVVNEDSGSEKEKEKEKEEKEDKKEDKKEEVKDKKEVKEEDKKEEKVKKVKKVKKEKVNN